MADLKNKTCCVIGAGKIYDYDWLRQSVCGDFIICADAGYLHAEKAGLVPDVIIGDFDSSVRPSGNNILVYPVRKDSTDTYLAINHGVSLGYTDFRVYAATAGSRLDHTVASLVMCAEFLKKGINVRLTDEKNEAYMLLPGTHTVEKTASKLSVFAFCGDVTGLTEKGVSYPLSDFYLAADNHLGVSNEITADRAEISFNSGILLIIRSKD